MWTQRDQLLAQQFMRRRLVCALHTGDANHRVPPARRLLNCYAAGVACAVLIVVAVAIYAVLRPGR